MKHLKLFEGFNFGMDENHDETPKYYLVKINHYLGEKNRIGTYSNLDKAMEGFLKKFIQFLKKEWNGCARNYFAEWDNNSEIRKITNWGVFLNGSNDPGETTYYIEDPEAGWLFEYELLNRLYNMEGSDNVFDKDLEWIPDPRFESIKSTNR